MESFHAGDHTLSTNIGSAYKHAGLSVAVTKRNGPLLSPVPPPLDEVKAEDNPGDVLEGKTNDLAYESAEVPDSVPDILTEKQAAEEIQLNARDETEEPVIEKLPAQPKLKRKRKSKKG